MKIVVQRVNSAVCRVDGEEVSRIGKGLLAYIGVAADDTDADLQKGVGKLTGLRIFRDEAGKLSLSTAAVGGELMLISNFTLLGRVRHGFRPDCTHAAAAAPARAMYDAFCEAAAKTLPVKKGVFGADMKITAEIDGPVNIIIDTSELLGAEK